MLWLTPWIALTVMGAIGAVVWANSLRFGRHVSREVAQMWAALPDPRPIDRGRIETLPGPVRRYLARAIGEQVRAVRTVRLRHRGAFRTKLDGAFLPIRGEQYFAADPPAFVWWGRVRVVPGLWFDARDRSVAGVGGVRAMAESSFTVVDSAGPEIDQGSLLRLLGEMVWFPTAFLDDRYVTWAAVDDQQARATLRVAGREVACVFHFGADDLPAAVSADRYRDVGGRAVSTPWSGDVADYRAVDCLLVPHRISAYWHVEGRRIPYAKFNLERLEHDVPTPFLNTERK